jgi:hypothetical protein
MSHRTLRRHAETRRRLRRERPLPPKPAGITWRDHLILLLHIAAELEHSLMIEYLYAAYSLGGKDAPKEEPKVLEWRDAILSVAREEMGHLLTVQNCLCLLGGPISFEREDYPWDTPYYPFQFRLEPLTLHSLAQYVFAEMPRVYMSAKKPPGLTTEEAEEYRIAQEAIGLLGKSAGRPVGEVYDSIVEIISDPAKIPDSDFDPDTYAVQASFDDWGRSYRPGPFAPHAPVTDAPPRGQRKTRVIVAQMATRTEAIDALRDLAGQGEAPEHRHHDQLEPSHFARFARIFDELQQIQKARKGWLPCRRVPTNPAVGQPGQVIKDSSVITNETSRAWAQLFNLRYRMLLVHLTHTFQLRRVTLGGPDDLRAAVMSKVFGEMYNLKAIAGILVRLPLGSLKDPRRAGPPFEMPFTLVLPSTEGDIWRLHRDLVRGSQELVDQLLLSRNADLQNPPSDAQRYLTVLRDLDLQSLRFIDGVLSGLRPSVRRIRK